MNTLLLDQAEPEPGRSITLIDLPLSIVAAIATYLPKTDLKTFRYVSTYIDRAIFTTFAKICYRKLTLKAQKRDITPVSSLLSDSPDGAKLGQQVQEIALKFPGSHILQASRDSSERRNREHPHMPAMPLLGQDTIDMLHDAEKRRLDIPKLLACLPNLQTIKLHQLNGTSFHAKLSPVLLRSVTIKPVTLILDSSRLSSGHIRLLLSSVPTLRHLSFTQTEIVDGWTNVLGMFLAVQLESLCMSGCYVAGFGLDQLDYRLQKGVKGDPGKAWQHYSIQCQYEKVSARMSGDKAVRAGVERILERTIGFDEMVALRTALRYIRE